MLSYLIDLSLRNSAYLCFKLCPVPNQRQYAFFPQLWPYLCRNPLRPCAKLDWNPNSNKSYATSQTCVISSNKSRRGTKKMGENRKRVERWECCSLGCPLGGGAWKRPCRGLPLVESAQYPSNHPAPSLSSLPSANRAGEQEMVWLAAMKTDRE